MALSVSGASVPGTAFLRNDQSGTINGFLVVDDDPNICITGAEALEVSIHNLPLVFANEVENVTLALYGVPANAVNAIDPALVLSTLLAKLADVANDAVPKNDPLNIPTDPEDVLTNASTTIIEFDVGA